MYYKVTANLILNNAPDLFRRLHNRSIAKIRPFGLEIVDSMNRAVIPYNQPDLILWCEQCHCPTPLQQERKIVYDRYFTNITATPIEFYETYTGASFTRYLEQLTNNNSITH